MRYNGPAVKLASVESIVRALNDAGVRYLIAGGLAVNAHGYLRFTKDIDVVIQLIPDNVTRAFAAFIWHHRCAVRQYPHSDCHEGDRGPAAGPD